MKTRTVARQPAKTWQPPGWSPPGAVAFLHGLIEGGEALAAWARSEPDVRWGKWLVAQGLAPYAWRQLKALGAANALPVELRETLRGAHYAAVADAELHTVELRNVLNCLAAAGVAPVLFKGAALAHSVYPDPACRLMGDLDLWVTADAMPLAQRALVQTGYCEHNKSDRPTDMQRQMSGEVQLVGSNPGQGLVELHWGTFAGEWLRRTGAVDEAEILCRAQPVQAAGCDAWTLCLEDALLQLAVHLAVNHQMAYPGVRGLLDVALLARVQGVDWETLAERAAAWRVKTAARPINISTCTQAKQDWVEAKKDAKFWATSTCETESTRELAKRVDRFCNRNVDEMSSKQLQHEANLKKEDEERKERESTHPKIITTHPKIITSCDRGGCWDTSGNRYNAGGGNTFFSSKGVCHKTGNQMQCP